MKKILVIIDMQNDFISGSLANPKGERVAAQVMRQIAGDYDFFALTRDTHGEDYLFTYEGKNLPVKHCVKNTPGWQIQKEIIEAVKRTGKPYRVYDKKGFGSPELAHDLGEMEQQIESVTIVGLCTDICVITNALMLRAHLIGAPIFYVPQAMNATSDENQAAAVRILNACQIYEKEDDAWNR